jgi:hypothetical protein
MQYSAFLFKGGWWFDSLTRKVFGTILLLTATLLVTTPIE